MTSVLSMTYLPDQLGCWQGLTQQHHCQLVVGLAVLSLEQHLQYAVLLLAMQLCLALTPQLWGAVLEL